MNQLGGWWRSWIAASGLGFIVAVYIALVTPDLEAGVDPKKINGGLDAASFYRVGLTPGLLAVERECIPGTVRLDATTNRAVLVDGNESVPLQLATCTSYLRVLQLSCLVALCSIILLGIAVTGRWVAAGFKKEN